LLICQRVPRCPTANLKVYLLLQDKGAIGGLWVIYNLAQINAAAKG
jgi:hypothetical protein